MKGVIYETPVEGIRGRPAGADYGCGGSWTSSSTGMQERGKRKITEKTRRPAALSRTIPTCANMGVNPPGIEPGSLGWKPQRARHDGQQPMKYKIDRRKSDRFCRPTSNFGFEMISILRGVVRHDAQNTLTSGIFRHDSHGRKPGSDFAGVEPCSPRWEASGETTIPPWSLRNYAPTDTIPYLSPHNDYSQIQHDDVMSPETLY
ncbi:hypothetical protein PR048_022657 [Dryococelus australis]|uniref:Uncharacterized protein n=1 Tax=Dryococelus australis TaxID=614101 RepID=A0ABQ9H1J3_9NEOP|nr:hypothetical protein PR048_022657 [Dryococelus australis]